MLRTKDILDESDSRVRASNTDVTFPLNDTNKNIIPESNRISLIVISFNNISFFLQYYYLL